jgi:hypothetical protein
MLAAPGMVQRMPGQFQALPDVCAAGCFNGPWAGEHAQGTEVLVAHPVCVVVEVAQGFVPLGGQRAHERQVAACGEQGGDVAGAEFGEAFEEPPGWAQAQFGLPQRR